MELADRYGKICVELLCLGITKLYCCICYGRLSFLIRFEREGEFFKIFAAPRRPGQSIRDPNPITANNLSSLFAIMSL